MFAAAIFDMDGLLIDSERIIVDAYVQAAADCGLPVAREHVLPIVGMSGPSARDALLALFGDEASLRLIGARARERMQPDGAAPVFDAKPGAIELVAGLAGRGIPCGVASSTRIAEIRRRLGAVDLERHFSALAGGDEVERGKPDPAIYLLAARRLGVDPGRCIAFEDSDHGAAAALAAGMRVVVVPDLKPPAGETARLAMHVLASLRDAAGHLERWFPHP